MNGEPSVAVWLPLATQPLVFVDCVADQFERGALTISRAFTDEEIDVFPAGAWREAIAIDGHGDKLATYRPVLTHKEH